MVYDAEDTSALLRSGMDQDVEEVYPQAFSPRQEHGLRKNGRLGGTIPRVAVAFSVALALGAMALALHGRKPEMGRAMPADVISEIGSAAEIAGKKQEVEALEAKLAKAKAELEALQAPPPTAEFKFHGSVPPNGDDPMWGCGLLGRIPGIDASGSVTVGTQRLIDGLKRSSSFNKVTFWNWNLAPQTDGSSKHHERLSKDFIFVPEQWGAGAPEERYVRPAGKSNFLDSDGQVCPAEMANLFLGMNEPDIAGSCMGNMFGKCSTACTDASVAAGDCPAAFLDKTLPPALPNSKGECNCWQHSHATGVGFWPLDGCSAHQPLPKLWEDPACVDTVIAKWKETAAIAHRKGYKFLSTPLVAVDIDYTKKFIEKACGCVGGQCSCTDASCGCPVYVGFHFYAYDCRPSATNGYKDFQRKLDAVKDIMEQYDFVKGAIINEIGMLNCAPVSEDPICVPDSGKYPASEGPDNSCPVNEELPNGMGTFIENIFSLVSASKTKTGKRVVKSVSWFNAHMDGGTYNLELFDEQGAVNAVGESYIKGCSKWAADIIADGS